MRAQPRRKIHIEPIKSPSPDVVNRNIITDTRAPLQDIQRYQQSRSGSKSPKFSHSMIFPGGNALKQIENLREENKKLQERINILEQQQREGVTMVVRNSKLTHEVQLLKDELQKYKSNLRSSFGYGSMSPYNSKAGLNRSNQQIASPDQHQPEILKQFSQRIQASFDENRRLQKKLQQQSSKNDHFERQNEMLKNQIEFYKKQQVSRPLFSSESLQSKEKDSSKIKSYSDLPASLKNQIQQMFRDYQSEVQRKNSYYRDFIEKEIEEFQAKLDQTNIRQRLLEERANRQAQQVRNLTPTPKKDKNDSMSIGTGTNWKTPGVRYSHYRNPSNTQEEEQIPDERPDSMTSSPIRMMSGRQRNSTSLFEQNQRLKHQNATLIQKVQYFTKQLENCQRICTQKERQCYLLNRRLQQMNSLPLEMKQSSQTPKLVDGGNTAIFFSRTSSIAQQPTPNWNQEQIQFYKDKVEILESQLLEKISQMNQLNDKLREKDTIAKNLNERFEQVNSLFESKMPDMQKIINQQKNKSNTLEDRIRQLEKELTKSHNKCTDFQEKNQNLQMELEKSLQKIRILSQEMEKRDHFIAQNLKSYAQHSSQIKAGLTTSRVEESLIELEQLENNKITFQQLRQEHTRLVQSLRIELVKKQKNIAELEKDKRMLGYEIQQLKSKQQSLNQIIQNFSAENSLRDMRESALSGQTHQQSAPYSCYLRDCIKGTVGGLDLMESKIRKILQEQ